METITFSITKAQKEALKLLLAQIENPNCNIFEIVPVAPGLELMEMVISYHLLMKAL